MRSPGPGSKRVQQKLICSFATGRPRGPTVSSEPRRISDCRFSSASCAAAALHKRSAPRPSNQIMDLCLGIISPSDASLALCMCLHGRLGASSILAKLKPEILEIVADLYRAYFEMYIASFDIDSSQSIPRHVRRYWSNQVRAWHQDPPSQHSHFRAGPVTCKGDSFSWTASFPKLTNF